MVPGISLQLRDSDAPLATATRDFEKGGVLERTRAFGGYHPGVVSEEVRELVCLARNPQKNRSVQKVLTTGASALCISEKHEQNVRVYVEADPKVEDLYTLTLRAIRDIEKGEPIVRAQRSMPKIVERLFSHCGDAFSAQCVSIGETDTRGLGVFSTEWLSRYRVIEIAPVVETPVTSLLVRYGFEGDDQDSSMMYLPLGVPCLLNDYRTDLSFFLIGNGPSGDSEKIYPGLPNTAWRLRVPEDDTSVASMELRMTEEIEQDMELLTCYGRNKRMLPTLMRSAGIRFDDVRRKQATHSCETLE